MIILAPRCNSCKVGVKVQDAPPWLRYRHKVLCDSNDRTQGFESGAAIYLVKENTCGRLKP